MIYHKIKVIVVNKVSVYHIVNTTTNVTHTMSLDYDTAMRKMRELNSAERAKHKAAQAA